MSDWSKPTLTSLYTNFLTEVSNRLNDSAMMNRTGGGTVPATVTLTSPPVGTVRWNSSSLVWEANTGTGATPSVPVWEPLAASYGITVSKANQWTTTRTIGFTGGDVTATAVNIDGTANISLTATLGTVVTAQGPTGSATAVPVITIDAKGRVTAMTTAALGTIAAQASSSVSITGGAISATALTLVQSTTAAPTVEGRVEWDTDDDLIVVGNGVSPVQFAPLIPTNPVTAQKYTFTTGCTWNGNAVPVLYGGTGGTDAATARSNLGIASMATQAATSVAITGGAISGTAITLVQSLTPAPTAEGVMEWDTNDDLLVIGASAATKVFAPLSPTAQVTAINYTFSTSCNWQGNVVTPTYGGTGVATLSGLAYGNGTSAFTAATAAQVKTTLGTLTVPDGGTGLTTLAGLAYGNGASAMSAATAAQVKAVLGTLTVADGGTGVATLSGLAFGNGTGAFSSATAAQIVAAISTTAVINATNSTACSGAASTFTSTTQNSQFNSIGVGTAGSAVAGEIRATNNVTAYYTSDKNLKTNIRPIREALGMVAKMRGVYFDWKATVIKNRGGEDGYFVRKHDVGVIAQEIEAVYPEAVATNAEGHKAVRYELLVPLLISAINELRQEVAGLKK